MGSCPLGPKDGLLVPPGKAYMLLTNHLITGQPLAQVSACPENVAEVKPSIHGWVVILFEALFIAPAYSRVRYRSPNFCPSVRSSVRPSVNIYVEVKFSRHQ